MNIEEIKETITSLRLLSQKFSIDYQRVRSNKFVERILNTIRDEIEILEEQLEIIKHGYRTPCSLEHGD